MKKIVGIVALCVAMAVAPTAASAHKKVIRTDTNSVVVVGTGVAAGAVVAGPIGAIVGGVIGWVVNEHHR